MMNKQFLKAIATMMIAVIIFLAFDVGEVLALTTVSNENCTSSDNMRANATAGEGIITAVMETIIALLNQTSNALYDSVVTDPEFQAARTGALLLVIAIYGAMVTFNMVNLRPGEIVSLLFKMAVIIAVTSETGWQFFDRFVGRFFMGTMIEMVEIFIGQTTAGATTGYAGQGDIASRIGNPLQSLNWPTAQIFSTQFFITVIGTFSIIPYGPGLAFLLVVGAYKMLTALFDALKTYIKCVVGLWFLFALAPIFFLFLLFRRTANLFEGWLNMVVKFTIEPILLFAFLSFFMTIIAASMDNLMNINWCWTEVAGTASNTGSEWLFWRPIAIDGKQIDGGIWTLMGGYDRNGNPLDIVFPLDTVDVMFFLLASYVGGEYVKFVSALSAELASSGLRISSGAESARQWFSSRGWTPGQLATGTIRGGLSYFK